MTSLLKRLAFPFTALLLMLLSYSPMRAGDFIGDDIGRIMGMGEHFTLEQMWSSGIGDRPLLGLSLWLDRAVLKFSAGAMRAENLLWLLAILLLLRRLVDLTGEKLQREISPWWRDGLLLAFCLHPLHTQTLTHVVQRGILLSSLGGLAATYWLLKAQFDYHKPQWKYALLAWLLALLAKPNIATLPFFWLGLAWLTGEKKRLSHLIPFFLVLLVPVVFYVVGGFNAQREFGGGATAFNYFSWQGKVLLVYLRLLLVPWGLKFNHDMALPSGPYWPGLALWVLYLAGFALLWLKARHKLVAWIFLGCLLALLPESSFFPIIHEIFEHRTFFPMVFLAWGLALCAPRIPRAASATLLALVILTYGTLSFLRNGQVNTFEKWALSELSHTCSASYLGLNLVSVLIARGSLAEAKRGVEMIEACPVPPITAPLVRDLINIALAPDIPAKELASLEGMVNSNLQLDESSRRVLNSSVSLQIRAKLKGGASYCTSERYFAQQLRFFFQRPFRHFNEISHYKAAANLCLQTLPPADFQALRIRAILWHYYHTEDATLAGDLQAAPAGGNWDYLRELITKPRLVL